MHTMMNKKKKLLVISHIEAIRVLISEILISTEEYEIITAEDETKGTDLTTRETPDLIILDIMTPRIEDYQITWMLHSADKWNIPIIMLSTSGLSRYSGEESGIEDAEGRLKPLFDPMALIERVNALLYRKYSNFEVNPLLRFSGNIDIGRELMARSEHYAKFAIGYAELDDLKAYNEHYNTTKGDRIIIRTRRIISNAVKQFGTRYDVIRHLSGNDFVFITTPKKIEPICQHIINTFDQEIPAYYDEESRTKGYITHKNDHSGRKKKFPLLTFSIAVITNLKREFTDFGEIGEIASEIKKYLRTLPGSNYIIDRRVNRRV